MNNKLYFSTISIFPGTIQAFSGPSRLQIINYNALCIVSTRLVPISNTGEAQTHPCKSIVFKATWSFERCDLTAMIVIVCLESSQRRCRRRPIVARIFRFRTLDSGMTYDPGKMVTGARCADRHRLQLLKHTYLLHFNCNKN